MKAKTKTKQPENPITTDEFKRLNLAIERSFIVAIMKRGKSADEAAQIFAEFLQSGEIEFVRMVGLYPGVKAYRVVK